uniref:G protein gamma domain-containing protein n=1 Tax=Neogobius melanostomus TaxID=47308 RepID=A0A8C6TGC9_9GOBI
MEELDVPQMRREVESLQYQLAINREKSSITVTELVKWIEGCVCDDPFLNPELMRANPGWRRANASSSDGTPQPTHTQHIYMHKIGTIQSCTSPLPPSFQPLL